MTVLAATALGSAPTALAAAPSPQAGHVVAAPRAADAKQPTGLQPMDGQGLTVPQREAMAVAVAQAHSTGKPVVVDALTTETQQTVAQPKGGFATTANPLPVRTRRSGSWAPVDTTLRKGADGTLAPVATAYGDVRFSGGGSGPLVVTSSDGTRYSVNWPTALPSPSVSGGTATYPEVLPGVDLVLSANASGGFSEVLVVKNAQAAKGPALANLRLATSLTGGRLVDSKAPDGVSIADGRGGGLDAGSPLMWDSNTALPVTAPKSAPAATGRSKAGTAPAQTLTQSQAAAAKAAPDPSDASHAGAAAHVSVVHTKASADSLALVPDAKLLGDPGTVFPVYVDPTFNWHPASSGNPAFDEVKQGSPCNGRSLYDNTGSAGDGGALGVGVNGWTSCIGIMRSYYQWQLPTVMWGATINSGTVNATKIYSASCSENPTVDLHWAGGIGSGTSWNNQPGYGGTISSAAFGPSYNPTYCPGNGSVTHGLDVTGAMQQSASGHWGQFTAVLTEDGYESSGNDLGFSRFTDNPSLQVQYNLPPTTPGTNDLSAVTGSQNAGCATNAPYPPIGKTIASNTPVLRSYVSDPDGDSLQATFKYWVDGSSSSATGLSGDNMGSGQTAQYSLPSSFVSSLSNGQTVDWQAQVTDGQAWSGWSPVCHFTAYPTGPDSPTTLDNAGYPNTDKPGGKTGAPAGTAAAFTVNGAVTGAPATKVLYGLDQQPATSNTPANQTSGMGSSVAATPADRWLLNENANNWSNDQYGSHSVVFQPGTAWVNDSIRGTVVAFNGSNGYGSTNGPVLDLTKSFSVSAWAKPNANGGVVIGQDGTTTQGFMVWPDNGTWRFAMAASDSGGWPYDYTSNSNATVHMGAWTQLTATYDAGSGQMTLYVNGAQAGTATHKPVAFNGSFAVGRWQNNGANANFFNGSISDVQTYARVLTGTEANTVYDSGTVNVTPLSAGPHTLWTAAADVAGDQSGMSAYRFLAAGDPNKQCASFAACLNNTAISPDSNTAVGAGDGIWGHSFSANDLTNAGWNSGQPVTVNGATFTMPVYGAGQADNILAANQTIPLPNTPAGAGSALVFLATSTIANLSAPGAVPNAAAPYVPAGSAVSGVYCFDSTRPSAYCPATGTVKYSDGSTQSYALVVPDWITGPSAMAAVTLPHWNTASGQTTPANGPKLYPFSVPLTPGKTPVSVTLPDVGTQASGPALHIFGMTTRNTTTGTAKVDGTTAAVASGQSWTGTWGSPTVGTYNFGSAFSDQTIRMNVSPSVAGNTLRIKLDNAISNAPVVLSHVTVAVSGGLQSSAGGATTDLKFGGSTGVTIPAGGMVYSDPLYFPLGAQQGLQISYCVSNTVANLPMNPWSDTAWTFMTPAGSGDQTTDTSGNGWSMAGSGSITALVTDVDVTTANIPTEAVLGDNVTDPGTPGTAGIGPIGTQGLAADLAAASPTTPTPFSTINESAAGNMLTQDFPSSSNYGGPSALSRIDRDILDQPGLNTVVLDEGLMDVLHGRSADSLTTGALTQLLTYLQANGINVEAVGLSPCDGYAGDGVSGANDPCTSTVDKARTTVNTWLSGGYPLGMGPWSTPSMYYIDADKTIGVPDTTNGETQLDPNGGNYGDHVNLDTTGYGALANVILGPQDSWPLDDGSGPIASDTASNTGNAYLVNNSAVGQNPATVTGGVTWVPKSFGQSTTAAFDGTSGYLTTSSGPVIDTTKSFSITAFADFSALPSTDATVVSESGSQGSAFSLKFNHALSAWCFAFSQGDGSAQVAQACTSTVPSDMTGWAPLLATYNATTRTASIYATFGLTAGSSVVAPWAATGNLMIGADQVGGKPADFYNGMIGDVQLWNYALTEDQWDAQRWGLGLPH